MSNEIQSLEVSPFAQALAERSCNEEMTVNAALIAGVGLNFDHFDQVSVVRGYALRNQAILNTGGNMVLARAVMVRASSDKAAEGVRGFFESSYQATDHQDKDQLGREALSEYADATVNSLAGELVKEFPMILMRTADRAAEISQETGVDMAEVVRTDDLYAQLMRRVYTKFEYAYDLSQLLKNTTGPKFKKTLYNSAVNLMAAQDSRIEFYLTNLDPETKDRVVEELMSGIPEVQNQVVDLTYKARQACALVYSDQLRRFWGQDAVETLPPFLRDNFVTLTD